MQNRGGNDFAFWYERREDAWARYYTRGSGRVENAYATGAPFEFTPGSRLWVSIDGELED